MLSTRALQRRRGMSPRGGAARGGRMKTCTRNIMDGVKCVAVALPKWALLAHMLARTNRGLIDLAVYIQHMGITPPRRPLLLLFLTPFLPLPMLAVPLFLQSRLSASFSVYSSFNYVYQRPLRSLVRPTMRSCMTLPRLYIYIYIYAQDGQFRGSVTFPAIPTRAQ